MDKYIYIEGGKIFCQINKAAEQLDFKTEKFIMYCTLLLASVPLLFGVFSLNVISIVAGAIIAVAAVLPLNFKKFLLYLDQRRQNYADKLFQNGTPVTGKIKKADYGMCAEFTHDGQVYRVRLEGALVTAQSYDTASQALVESTLDNMDRPSYYLNFALKRGEDLSMLFTYNTKEIFLLGTPTVNVAEYLRSKNQKIEL